MLESVSVSVFTVGVCFVVFVVCCTAVSPIIPEMEGNQCIYWHAFFFFMYNFGECSLPCFTWMCMRQVFLAIKASAIVSHNTR